MADQSIELTAYDPTWPARFAEQQTRLAALLRPWLAGLNIRARAKVKADCRYLGAGSIPYGLSRGNPRLGKRRVAVLAGRPQ